MADVEDFLSFRGSSDQEAEDFIRAVRIQAFKAGKHDDLKWICSFASTALAGKALRWYLRLPTATQQDWLQLQAEILEHEWRDNGMASSVLTPAAEPVPAAAPPLRLNSSSELPTFTPPHRTRRIARIRVIAGDTINGYLGEIGVLAGVVSDKASALRITYDSSQFPCELELLDSKAPFAFLGGQHGTSENEHSKFGPGESGSLGIRPCCHPSDTDSTKYMLGGLTGDYLVSIWIVCEDRSLVAVAPQEGCIYNLTPILVENEDDYYLFMGSDPVAIRAVQGSDKGITGVRLILEHED